jgi:hypothetical protein
MGQGRQRTGTDAQFGTQGGGQRGGGTRDTAAMRRFMQMRNQQGGTRDTAAMRRFMQQRNQQGGQQGARRDTSARRRNNTQEVIKQDSKPSESPVL